MAQRVSFDPGGICVPFRFWLCEITLLTSVTLLHLSRAANDVDLNGVVDRDVRHSFPDTDVASPVRAVYVERTAFRGRDIPLRMTKETPHMYIGPRNEAMLLDKLAQTQRGRNQKETSGAISNHLSEISDLFPTPSLHVLQRVLMYDQRAAGLLAHEKINNKLTAAAREVHLHRTHGRNANTGDGDSMRVKSLFSDIDRATIDQHRAADQLHVGSGDIEDRREGVNSRHATPVHRHKRDLPRYLKSVGRDRIIRGQLEPNANESMARTKSPKQETNKSDSIGSEPTETPVLLLPTTHTTTVRDTTISLSTPHNAVKKTEHVNSTGVATIAPRTSNAVQTPSPTPQPKASISDVINSINPNDTIEEEGVPCSDPNCYASRLPYHWTKDATWALVSILFLLFVLTFFVLYTGLWKKRNPMPYPLEHRHIPDHGSRRVNIAELLRTRLAAIPKRFRNRHLRFGKGLNRKKYEELPLHRPNGRCGDDDYDFEEDGEEDLYTRDEHSV